MSASAGYAYSLGLVAAVNPCGFAMLPAYLTYYVGVDVDDKGGSTGADPVGFARSSVARSLAVGGAMTAGFAVVFGLIGLVWSSISSVVGERLPWVTAAMGVGLVVLGLVMLSGRHPTVGVPRLDLDLQSRQLWTVFLFGVSYAIASLSCTLPLFVATMTTSFGSSFTSGLNTFVMYALGMGTLVTVLTVTVGLARTGMVRTLRRLLPHMGRIAGAIMVVAGATVAYYGWAEIRQLAGSTGGTGFARTLTSWQSSISGWITRTGPIRVGLIAVTAVAVVAAITAVAVSWRKRPAAQATGPDLKGTT